MTKGLDKLVYDITSLLGDFAGRVKKVRNEFAEIWASQIHQNFESEGYIDMALQKWIPRKVTPIPYRKILIGFRGGTLRRRATTVISENMGLLYNSLVVRIDVRGKDGSLYGVKHNEGLGKMPQRKFIGRSVRLEKRLDASVLRNMRKR